MVIRLPWLPPRPLTKKQVFLRKLLDDRVSMEAAYDAIQELARREGGMTEVEREANRMRSIKK
jgi:hypothetical protein